MRVDNIRSFPDRRAVSRFRSARHCSVCIAGHEFDAVVRNISAAGAFVTMEPSVAIDDIVMLRHPEAGEIRGRVVRLARDGAALAFTVGEHAATFALAAMCTGMTVRADATAIDA